MNINQYGVNLSPPEYKRIAGIFITKKIIPNITLPPDEGTFIGAPISLEPPINIMPNRKINVYIIKIFSAKTEGLLSIVFTSDSSLKSLSPKF